MRAAVPCAGRLARRPTTTPDGLFTVAELVPTDPVSSSGSSPGPAGGPPDLLTIEYRPEQGLVAVRWAGACTLDRLRDVYARVGTMLTRTAARRVLLDTRDREVIGDDAARWVATEAYATLAAGRKAPLRLAYAVPETVAKAFGSGPLETLGELIQVGIFTSPGAALAWLLLR